VRVVVPVRADVPTRTLPWVVAGLTGANVAVFAYVVSVGPDAAAEVFDRFALVPREFLRGAARNGPPVWVTPFTSMFLHGGLLHLAGNLFYLWVFGRQIEELLGAARFALFYVACGLVAGAIHVASDPDSWLPTIGASGAISTFNLFRVYL
jgi:membrane associated rhomboid family serine protease